MLALSNILGELVAEYVHAALDGGRECRLVVPGLIDRLAVEIHEFLLSKEIKSYLVIGNDSSPDEEKKWIKPVGLTSRRIGSFVAIACTGQLVHIQDSIRGSGGAIRSLAFSEEWPWVDKGSEAFRFDGPVLDRLVKSWTNIKEEQDWLREFIIKGLVKSTRPCSRRTKLLLEDILGNFNPALYPVLHDVRTKLLFHCGVPCPSQDIPDVGILVNKSNRLCQKVIEHCQKEDDIRGQVRDRIPEVIAAEDERSGVRESIDILLDGIGRSTTSNLGLLSLNSCWSVDRNDTTHWLRLHAARLSDLFSVLEQATPELTYEVLCQRAVKSSNGKVLATFAGETVRIIGHYNIPLDQFIRGSWELQLLYRGRPVVAAALQSPQGTAELLVNTSEQSWRYTKKIPLRIALTCQDELRVDDRLTFHLCGEERPSFVVIEPGFEVIDPSGGGNEETPDKKIEVDEAVQLYLFDCENQEERIFVRDIDGNELDIIGTGQPSIWRCAQRIDPSLEPSGQVILVCTFGNNTAVLCFEAKDVDKGEFTLEDEFRIRLVKMREDRIREIENIFGGESRELFLRLGKLNDPARRRIALAQQMTNRLGWRPLLADLLIPGNGKSASYGDYINYIGSVDGESFKTLSLPDDALALLRVYSEARDAVYSRVLANIDRNPRLEHPVYASHPVFVETHLAEIEHLLVAYLESYRNILTYLQERHRQLEWSQIFVLSHLDSAVHWKDPLKNAFSLVGPWHPLILAKRFMLQSALFTRAQRFLRDSDGKNFRRLCTLLEGIHGFRWLPGISSDDRRLEPLYVSATSDPGWHLAIKTELGSLVSVTELSNLAGLCERLRNNFGLESKLVPAGADDLASSCLSSYLRAFPSRRSLGIRVRGGYSGENIIRAVDRFLHNIEEEGPSHQGLQLPGGIRLFFENPLGQIEDVQWSSPPIYAYHYQDDPSCLSQENPDIYMLPPGQSLSFLPGTENFILPRGLSHESVFSEALTWLTEGQSLVPKSISYDFDADPIMGESLGEKFKGVASQIGALFDRAVSVVRSVGLPQRLDCPWAVTPGEGLDPAILVKYVRDGIARSIQERALWDYRIDISSQQNSFYILSTIPRGFIVQVSGVFGSGNLAGTFIEELGRIGIAIGGEALKSGRHALGVIGLVGAVRLFLGIGGNGLSPLKRIGRCIGFLVPVDSFATFFGQPGSIQPSETKRTDLLAIQIVLPDSPSSKMKIYACGVESKFVSGTFSQSMAQSALAQAQATSLQFQSLSETGLKEGAMPERLGLLALLKFGLRISSPSSPQEIAEWVQIEQEVFQSVLQGRFEYLKADYEAVLVTTEMGLPGVAEVNAFSRGFWIRLNKNHWPAVSDTPQLDSIRQQLANLFDIDECGPAVSQPAEPAPASGEEEASPGTQLPVIPTPAASPVLEFIRPSPSDVAVTVETDIRPLRRILVGVDDGRRSVYYDPQSPVDPLDNLNMMVTGSSGKGKTQFLKYLICQLRNQDKNILILDFKNDFASDSVFTDLARLSKVFVTFDGLPYNPLIPYPIRHPATGELFIQCGQHIAGVASVLKRTYGLGAQQQVAVKNAIVGAFDSMGIQVTGPTRYEESIRFPDFSIVGDALRHDNQAAFNRLDPLFTLGLFRDEYRNNSFHSLVGGSSILDLSQIPSDQIKDTLAQLVVLSAHAYYNSQQQLGTIRQVLIFDEAHRVLNSDYMLRLVRECRAYGVGVILSSQYPSDFPPEISGSMATKVIHGNERDIDRVRAIIQLIGCEGQEASVSSLDRFQAFVDNRHYPHTLIRTMNYPLFLVWSYLREHGASTRDALSGVDGFDTDKLPVMNLVRQLERLGLAEERDGRLILLTQE